MPDLEVPYLENVKFGASPARGGADYLQCDGCHKVSTATEVCIPKTLYYDGKHLTTRYTGYWFCPECMNKLKEAVNRAVQK